MLSIVCVTYNSEKYIRSFLESVKEFALEDSELIIIDNSGKNYGLDFVKVNADGSYPSGLNQGIAMATKDSILCCNPDIKFTNFMPGAFGKEIIGPMSNYCSGVQGSKVPSQVTLLEVKFLIGFCFIMSRRAYKDIGPFDEQFVYEQDDLDYSMRARKKGYRLVVDPSWYVEHAGHASAITDANILDKRYLSLYRMFKKYPTADFTKEIGGGWRVDWLEEVARRYPDIKGIQSYERP